MFYKSYPDKKLLADHSENIILLWDLLGSKCIM